MRQHNPSLRADHASWVSTKQHHPQQGVQQLRGEALLCSLLGLCHTLVTIPEYPWKPRTQLLDASLGMVLLR